MGHIIIIEPKCADGVFTHMPVPCLRRCGLFDKLTLAQCLQGYVGPFAAAFGSFIRHYKATFLEILKVASFIRHYKATFLEILKVAQHGSKCVDPFFDQLLQLHAVASFACDFCAVAFLHLPEMN